MNARGNGKNRPILVALSVKMLEILKAGVVLLSKTLANGA